MTRNARPNLHWAVVLTCAVLGVTACDGVTPQEPAGAEASHATSSSASPTSTAASQATKGFPSPGGYTAHSAVPSTQRELAQYRHGYPGAAIVTEVIGPAGGSLRLGDIEIVVPPNAVSRSTRFQIRVAPEVSGRHVMAEFLPHGVDFNRPVTLILPHASTTAERGAPVVWWNGFFWQPQPTTVLRDGRAMTTVRHFSFYGVFARGSPWRVADACPTPSPWKCCFGCYLRCPHWRNCGRGC